MALTEAETRMYTDIVSVVNRTDKNLEFRFDSVLYIIPANGKKNLPRFIAHHGIKQHAIKYGPSGLATESLLGIEGDKLFITEKINADQVNELKEADRFGEEYEESGALKKKKRINLRPQQENFTGNNV